MQIRQPTIIGSQRRRLALGAVSLGVLAATVLAVPSEGSGAPPAPAKAPVAKPTATVAKPAPVATATSAPQLPATALSTPVKPLPVPATPLQPKLFGFADLHTHPMSHLGFGGKGMHGAPDVDILLPPGTTLGCNNDTRRARNMAEALGNCNATHGGWGAFDNTCGDHLRAAIVSNALDGGFWHNVGFERNLHNDHPHAGHPNFEHWPHHSSILHQQMWWEWVKRAHAGGLRVLVALTVNSETLAEILNGTPPYDDKTVADLQIDETIRFVNRHNRKVNKSVKPEDDFMEIAYSAADAERIIREGRLAVILGMEIDKIGNFGKPGVKTDEAAVRAEIQRLYRKGIRYVFPIHLVDNAFGGTAVYSMLFNLANKHQNGSYFAVTHSGDPNVTYRANFIDNTPGVDTLASQGIYALLQGIGALPAPCFNDVLKCQPPPGVVRCCGSYPKIMNILKPTAQFDVYKTIKPGHVNAKGLTPLGKVAIREMMKLGMIMDVDHMSERSMRETFGIAESVPGGYPLVMGHNGVRGRNSNERAAPADLVRRLVKLGGMMGAGTAHTNATDFVSNYLRTWREIQEGAKEAGLKDASGLLGLGTDANGFERLPHRGSSADPFGPDKKVTVPGDAWNHPPAQLTCTGSDKISVRSARIGCLDIQHTDNLGAIVGAACNGRTTCSYKAPTEAEYRRMGVQAATRTFCTQAMEIVYRCGPDVRPGADSRSFYASFFRESGITTKQKKPNGKEWDYIVEGGVSHYGLMPEFLHEVKQENATVYQNVMSSADAFVRMWKKVESVRGAVRP